MGHRISPARVFLLVALFFLALTGTASAYQFSFAAPIPRQQQVQRAISFQLNRQVARHWVIDPVSFVPSGGISIYVLAPDAITAYCGSDAEACHFWNSTTDQAAILLSTTNQREEIIAASHEIIETETDENTTTSFEGRKVEPADPVSHLSYRLMGVQVSDFVYPRWYRHSARGPWDQEHSLTALQVDLDQLAGKG